MQECLKAAAPQKSTAATQVMLGSPNRLISGSGLNFDNLVEKPFMVRFPCCNFLIIHMLQNKINKIPTTTRNQTV